MICPRCNFVMDDSTEECPLCKQLEIMRKSRLNPSTAPAAPAPLKSYIPWLSLLLISVGLLVSLIGWKKSIHTVTVPQVTSPETLCEPKGNPNHDSRFSPTDQAEIMVKPGHDTRLNPTDQAEMIWVPGGTFTMGSIEGVGLDREHPAHQVTLSGYSIYKYEVTVAQYRKFCSATSRALPEFPSGYSWTGKTGWNDPALQQHPIVNVRWNDAKDYADWAGVQLPTEAQWEYAARGSQGRNYPWGGTATAADPENGWDQTKCANYYNSYNVNKSTWPGGSFSAGASWCGAQDMAGNVTEWSADWLDSGGYSSSPVMRSYNVLRGGSWYLDGIEINTRAAFRIGGRPGYCSFFIGFRCTKLP